jgi:hypothetical protein
MESARFDSLTRHVATSQSRRRTLRLLATGIGALLLAQSTPEEAAAKCVGLNQRCHAKKPGIGRWRKCCRGTRCKAGRCRANACRSATGLIYCAGRCVDILADESNCGSCGTVCQSFATCCAGRCTFLGNDDSNCGRCGNVCPMGENGLRRDCDHGTCDTSCFAVDQTCCDTCEKPCCGGYPCTTLESGLKTCTHPRADLGQPCVPDTTPGGPWCKNNVPCTGGLCRFN